MRIPKDASICYMISAAAHGIKDTYSHMQGETPAAHIEAANAALSERIHAQCSAHSACEWKNDTCVPRKAQYRNYVAKRVQSLCGSLDLDSCSHNVLCSVVDKKCTSVLKR